MATERLALDKADAVTNRLLETMLVEAADVIRSKAAALTAGPPEASAVMHSALEAAAGGRGDRGARSADARADDVTDALFNVLLREIAVEIRGRTAARTSAYDFGAESTAPAPLPALHPPPSPAAAVEPPTALLPATAIAAEPAALQPPAHAPAALAPIRGGRLPSIASVTPAAGSASAALSSSSADAYVRVPTEPTAARDLVSELRAEQARIDGEGTGVISDAAFEAVVVRLVQRTASTPSAAGGAAADVDGERHLRAWARLVFATCNEVAQAEESSQRELQPLSPPSIQSHGALSSHRQSRSRETALERLAAAAALSSAATPTPGSSQPQQQQAPPPPHQPDEDMYLGQLGVGETAGDIDTLVRSSLRTHEDQVQIDVSEALLRQLVGEVAEELGIIETKQRQRSDEQR